MPYEPVDLRVFVFLAPDVIVATQSIRKGGLMLEVENPKEFAEWLRDIAQHIEEGSSLIKSVKTGMKDTGFGADIKVIEIEFNRPRLDG
jgi:hypothetical protein